MFYLYILKSIKYPKTYVGISDNINRRLLEHNSGKAKFTVKYKPWQVIYKEQFASRSEAFKRERYFKSRAGREKIKQYIPR